MHAKLSVLLAEAFKRYPEFMRRQGEASRSIHVAVVDGNAKLSGRICARAHAEAQRSEELETCILHGCSASPAFKKRRCAAHSVTEKLADPFPPQTEAIVSHRQSRQAQAGEPYNALLKTRFFLQVAGYLLRGQLLRSYLTFCI